MKSSFHSFEIHTKYPTERSSGERRTRWDEYFFSQHIFSLGGGWVKSSRDAHATPFVKEMQNKSLLHLAKKKNGKSSDDVATYQVIPGRAQHVVVSHCEIAKLTRPPILTAICRLQRWDVHDSFEFELLIMSHFTENCQRSLTAVVV